MKIKAFKSNCGGEYCDRYEYDRSGEQRPWPLCSSSKSKELFRNTLSRENLA